MDSLAPAPQPWDEIPLTLLPAFSLRSEDPDSIGSPLDCVWGGLHGGGDYEGWGPTRVRHPHPQTALANSGHIPGIRGVKSLSHKPASAPLVAVALSNVGQTRFGYKLPHGGFPLIPSSQIASLPKLPGRNSPVEIR